MQILIQIDKNSFIACRLLLTTNKQTPESFPAVASLESKVIPENSALL